MRRASLFRFYILMFIEIVAANMVHPVTPTFLSDLQMPEFMFGAAFAAMSLTNFLFCPFWGTVGDSIGRVKTLVITITFYAFGQLMFLYSTTIWQILTARMISGVFSGGCTVCLMAYVADVAEPNRCGKHMAICAALTSAAIAVGYLVGGILGDISVRTAFLSQFALLCLSAFGMGVLLLDGTYYQKHKVNLVHAVNPFSVFTDSRALFNGPMVVFLTTVFLACFASTAYDNAFNYYLKDQFRFPPSYNGYIYAAIGVVGISFNMTLGLWLQRKTGGRLPLAMICLAACLTLTASLKISQVGVYIAVNMIFYVCNSMYLPLQQALAIRQWKGDHGTISGVFSSVRAAGMVSGSLSAGFLYELAPRLPMGVCAGVFFLAAAIVLFNIYQYKEGKR